MSALTREACAKARALISAFPEACCSAWARHPSGSNVKTAASAFRRRLRALYSSVHATVRFSHEHGSPFQLANGLRG